VTAIGNPKERVMRPVIVSNIMSLDGYYEGPGGNVMALPMDAAFDAYNLERMRAAGTVLLGRRSYQGFSSYWPGVADHPPEPESNRAYSKTNRELSRMWNRVQKAVVSDSYSPEADNPWHDTTTAIAGKDLRAWLTEHKQRDGGDIVIFGSRTLWNSLLAAGLIDELHLMVGAVVLGGGTLIFSTPVDRLELLEARRFESSANLVLRYQPMAR
jgi:dihydrofolate reductase